mgnify:CR=1 FL=1
MCCSIVWLDFFFEAEDGIRDAQESRGLGDVYKRQELYLCSLGVHVPPSCQCIGSACTIGDLERAIDADSISGKVSIYERLSLIHI